MTKRGDATIEIDLKRIEKEWVLEYITKIDLHSDTSSCLRIVIGIS